MLSSASKASIFHHAETLLSDLAMVRSTAEDKTNPIIFIAHSLVGIVVKDALSPSGNEKTFLNEILPATKGVMFLGTPHHGTKIASLGKIAFELARIFLQRPNLQVRRWLEQNSETLKRIARGFGQALSSGEDHGTLIPGRARHQWHHDRRCLICHRLSSRDPRVASRKSQKYGQVLIYT
jgi:hypothetical protein